CATAPALISLAITTSVVSCRTQEEETTEVVTTRKSLHGECRLFSAPAHQRAEEARGLCAGHDDAVARHELVVRHRVADLDALPLNPEDLIGAAGGAGAGEVGLLGEA